MSSPYNFSTFSCYYSSPLACSYMNNSHDSSSSSSPSYNLSNSSYDCSQIYSPAPFSSTLYDQEQPQYSYPSNSWNYPVSPTHFYPMTSFPDSNIDELSPTSPLSLHPLPYPSLPTDSYQNILTISPLSTVTEPVPVSSSISKHSTTTVTTRKENLRLQYNYRQRYMLNEIFAFIPYPNCIQKSIIADRIGCTREQIRIWFQNKRRLAAQRSSNQNNNQNKRLTRNEINAIQHGISSIDKQELEQILIELNNHKNAPQRLSASKRR